jgi:RND family efflux transporter MFP subunit
MIKTKHTIIASVIIALFGLGYFLTKTDAPAKTDNEIAISPALNVTASQPLTIDIPLTLTANGSIAAWQEAIIGAEVGELRLKEVRVEVGETVRKGQVLALFADESVLADIAQRKASLEEAQASLSEAQLNASRAKQVSESGALSAQQISQYLTSEKTARARVALAKAQLDNQLLRQRHTRVIASDDGVISSRTATLGAVVASGQELFRLIRQHRLEWRGEVTASEMAQLQVGTMVNVKIPQVAEVEGKIRYLAPTLDPQSRNGLIYVDLPDANAKGIRAGMFAQGEFNLGNSPGLTVPQEALSLREGFSFVFRLSEQTNVQNKDQAKVTQVKVQLGRRAKDRYEILSGIKPDDRLVASGSAFLADGDVVRVVQ